MDVDGMVDFIQYWYSIMDRPPKMILVIWYISNNSVLVLKHRLVDWGCWLSDAGTGIILTSRNMSPGDYRLWQGRRRQQYPPSVWDVSRGQDVCVCQGDRMCACFRALFRWAVRLGWVEGASQGTWDLWGSWQCQVSRFNVTCTSTVKCLSCRSNPNNVVSITM